MQWKTNGNWVIFSEINRIIEKSPFIIDYIQIDDQINIKKPLPPSHRTNDSQTQTKTPTPLTPPSTIPSKTGDH